MPGTIEMPAKKQLSAVDDNKKRVFFDCETHPFTEEFKNSKSNALRLKLAPDPRVSCAYIEHLKQYEFYEPNDTDLGKFAGRLSEADEIISFNGDQFDFLVLRKWRPGIFDAVVAGITAGFRHLDLMQQFRKETGAEFWFSLHKMALLNLGKGKHTSGRSMESLNLDELKVACKSDVKQLYRLWLLWRAGKIKYPPHPTPRNIGWDDEDGMEAGPGSELSLPDVCPACGVENTLFDIPPDRDDMTEGQEADYDMGFRLTQMCRHCALLIDDGEPFAQLPEVLKELRKTQPWVVDRLRISHSRLGLPSTLVGGRAAKPLLTKRPKKPKK